MTPIIVVHGGLAEFKNSRVVRLFESKRMCLPSGSWFGHQVRAAAWLMIATWGVVSMSRSLKMRPRNSVMPKRWKYSGETMEPSITGASLSLVPKPSRMKDRGVTSFWPWPKGSAAMSLIATSSTPGRVRLRRRIS